MTKLHARDCYMPSQQMNLLANSYFSGNQNNFATLVPKRAVRMFPLAVNKKGCGVNYASNMRLENFSPYNWKLAQWLSNLRSFSCLVWSLWTITDLQNYSCVKDSFTLGLQMSSGAGGQIKMAVGFRRFRQQTACKSYLICSQLPLQWSRLARLILSILGNQQKCYGLTLSLLFQHFIKQKEQQYTSCINKSAKFLATN